MQLKLYFALGFASLTTATQMDAPAVKSALTSIAASVGNVDKAVNAITEANIATQVIEVTAQITKLSQELISAGAKLKGTKALGIFDIASLSSAATPLQQASMQLMTDVIAKRTIIVKGKQAEPLFKSFKQMQNGTSALLESFLTQIPSQFAAQVPKGETSAVPAGFNFDAAKLQDLVFDITLAVFKGSDTTVKVSGGLWPLPPKKRSVAIGR